MNILEAIKLVEEGKMVKVCVPDEDTFYIFEAEILPFKKKEFCVMCLWNYVYRGHFMPKRFSDLNYSSNDSLEIAAIRSNEFVEISMEDVMKEIQEGWKKHQEGKDGSTVKTVHELIG